ncbi:MAG: beta-glucosidase H [Planctomycetota bacterium]
MNETDTNEMIEQILKEMSLSEKVSLCHSATMFSLPPVERLDIPALTMSDGPHGVRCEIAEDSWEEVDTDEDFGTYLPTGTALAATWSRECARRFGKVLGAEARDRGKDIILGPGINIVRSPLCGRNFEYYGEDPCHISEMVVPVVGGIQSQNTAACVKHYAMNSQELNRHGVDARVDERTLREIYLPGFEAAVRRGNCLTVMGAYNCFRGQHCCHNDYLLNHILKDEWEFEGAVVSDWGGTYDTFEAARHGLDIEMGTGGPPEGHYLGDAFEEAIENGEIRDIVLDDKVRRILHVMSEIGMLHEDRKNGERNTREHQRVTRDIAEEAIVLLKNEADLLPLNHADLDKILVVGENAVKQHHKGGNSSAVKALYEVTPLEGLEKLLGDEVEIEYIQGYPQRKVGETIPTEYLGIADRGAGARGWTMKFYDNRECNGQPVHMRTVSEPEFDWEEDLPEGLSAADFSCILETTLIAPESGTWTLYLDGCPHAMLSVDDEPLMQQKDLVRPAQAREVMELEEGEEYNLNIQIIPDKNARPGTVRLGFARGDEPEEGSDAGEDLVARAEEADMVLFFGGLNHQYDTEGCDRQDMKLHGGQDELISTLAAANRKTAVILIAGSPVEMPWAEEVPAIVQMWYAGMEGGNAIARILSGEVNPSGKLPFTFPRKLEDSPAHYLGDYQKDLCHYREGVFVGYRWFDERGIEPLFEFGYGLSYTEFEYSDLRIEPTDGPEDGLARVRVCVTNIGDRVGREALQLYIGDKNCSVPRPERELKGFEKVELKPGQTKEVLFEINRRDLSFFHPVERRWICESGEFEIEVGASSRDIRLRDVFEI